MTFETNRKIHFEHIKGKIIQGQEYYIRVLNAIAAEANQPSAEVVQRWLSNADGLFIVYSEGTPIGFAAYRFLDNNTIHFSSIMVIPSYQGRKIGKTLARKVLAIFFKRRLRYGWFRPWALFAPLYIIFRTQNPRAYMLAAKNANLFPGVERTIPSPYVIKIASVYSRELWPHTSFIAESFVLRNAYAPYPSLALDFNKVPWTNNPKIDGIFKERLYHVSEKTLDALLVVGEMNGLITCVKVLLSSWTYR